MKRSSTRSTAAARSRNPSQTVGGPAGTNGPGPKARKTTTQISPALLSGGNPQITKAFGNEPVQSYIAAMPGWKRAAGEQIDALITQAIPDVAKAVKWNSPLYGVESGVWFLSLHCFAKYIKIAFFRGAAMEPVPPVASKQKNVRYLHVYEDEPLDESQFVEWVRQASRLPGEKM